MARLTMGLELCTDRTTRFQDVVDHDLDLMRQQEPRSFSGQLAGESVDSGYDGRSQAEWRQLG